MKTLDELKKENLPKLQFDQIFKAKETCSESDRNNVQKYLDNFVSQNEKHECIQCGVELTGILGSFRWGLVSGEGHCCNCGYPARAHHSIKDENEEEMFTIKNYVLQYHPEVLDDK